MKKKASAVTLLALASLAVSIACAGGAVPSQPTAPAAGPAAPQTAASPMAAPKAAPAGPLKEVKIGWTPSFVFLPIPVAVDTGAFEQEGLKVTLVDFQGGAEVTSAMLGKSIDLAATQAERPAILAENGQEAKNIMHLQAQQAFGVITRKDLNIQPGDWAALKGKRLSMTRPGSGTDLTLRALLRLNNLEPDRDVQIIGVGGAAQTVAALEAKQIDGGINAEPVLTQVTEVQPIADMFLDLRKEGPDKLRNVAFITLQANADYIDQNPEIVKSAIRAIAQTQKHIRENPSIAVEPIKRYFPNTDDAILLQIARNEGPTYRAAISRESWQNLMEVQVDAGILKADVPYDQVTVGPEFQQLWQLSD